jgi:hypothetical protein
MDVARCLAKRYPRPYEHDVSESHVGEWSGQLTSVNSSLGLALSEGPYIPTDLGLLTPEDGYTDNLRNVVSTQIVTPRDHWEQTNYLRGQVLFTVASYSQVPEVACPRVYLTLLTYCRTFWSLRRCKGGCPTFTNEDLKTEPLSYIHYTVCDGAINGAILVLRSCFSLGITTAVQMTIVNILLFPPGI